MNRSPEVSKRKIIHVLNVLQYSGAEVMLTDAYPFFGNDYEQYVLATGPELGPYAAKLQETGFKIFHIRRRKSIAYFVEMFKFFRNNKFDVVHIHASHAYFVNALLAKFSHFNSKIFRTYHDVFHECSRYFRIKATIQYFICRNLLKIKGVAIGKSVHKVEKIYFKNETVIVDNWIDDTKFRSPTQEEANASRKELNINPDAFVVLTVGTCNDKKCHNDIFDSIARIKDKVPNLIFLHRGTGENLNSEKDHVEKLGIRSNVIFVDYVDFLPKIFWASDCFILASKREGLGDVIIEAIATSLPVILYNGYGMMDFIPAHQQDYGYWIDPNTQQFDDYIENIYLMKKNNAIEDFKKNARKFFDNNFSRTKSLTKLRVLYEGLN